jgi:hypothetical protein
MGETLVGKDVPSILDHCHEDPTMAEDIVDLAHIPVPPPAYSPWLLLHSRLAQDLALSILTMAHLVWNECTT